MNSKDATLAGRYASALFLAARGAKALDDVHKDLDALAEIMDSRGPETKALFRPRLPAAAKGEALRRASGRRLHVLTETFIALLLENKRLALFPAAVASFARRVDEDRGIVRVRVRSATPLTDAQARMLAKDVEKLLSKGRTPVTAELDVKVDPSLLGGVVLRAGDRKWDLSFKGKMAKLRESLLENN